MGFGVSQAREWAVFSDNSLQRAALRQVLGTLDAAAAYSGPHGQQSYAAGKARLGAGGIVLADLDHAAMRSGRHAPVFAAFEQVPLVLFVQDRAEIDALLPLPRTVRAIIDGACPEDLVQAILKLVASGHHVLPSPLQPRPTMRPRGGAVPSDRDAMPAARLTTRECQIAEEVAAGRSNKEIARLLGLAVNTVNVHLAAVRRKLGVHNRTQIALSLSDGKIGVPVRETAGPLL